MALFGKGMLLVLNEVKRRDEADFTEWYNREHIDERIALPGFKRARRYVAVRGSPKFLATYECSKVGDLATPGYLALLANQSPWSQRVMNRFTRFKRMTLRIQLDLTTGIGGSLTVVRFEPAAENDLKAANAPAQKQGFDYPRTEEAEWVLLLESGEPEAGEAAARKLFTTKALKQFGVSKPPIVGSYRLLFTNQR